jgi:hypothetical protein
LSPVTKIETTDAKNLKTETVSVLWWEVEVVFRFLACPERQKHALFVAVGGRMEIGKAPRKAAFVDMSRFRSHSAAIGQLARKPPVLTKSRRRRALR